MVGKNADAVKKKKKKKWQRLLKLGLEKNLAFNSLKWRIETKGGDAENIPRTHTDHIGAVHLSFVSNVNSLFLTHSLTR